jgi:hypothetical protein
MQTLKEVRTISGVLEACFGRGDIAVTALPDLPPRAGSASPTLSSATAPQRETEVDGYLISLSLPPPRACPHRAASRLEQGRALGEERLAHQADRKA